MSLTTAPSIVHCWLLLEPIAVNEVCWPDRLPPTFWPLITMPGVCWSTTQGSRAVGIVSSASFEKLADSVVDRRVESRLNEDAVADSPLESGELERHDVRADRNAGEAIRAAFHRYRGLRLNERRAAQRDRDAWQDGAGAIGNLSEDFAHADLRGRRHHAAEDHKAHEQSRAARRTAHTPSWRPRPPTRTTYKNK